MTSTKFIQSALIKSALLLSLGNITAAQQIYAKESNPAKKSSAETHANAEGNGHGNGGNTVMTKDGAITLADYFYRQGWENYDIPTAIRNELQDLRNLSKLFSLDLGDNFWNCEVFNTDCAGVRNKSYVVEFRLVKELPQEIIMRINRDQVLGHAIFGYTSSFAGSNVTYLQKEEFQKIKDPTDIALAILHERWLARFENDYARLTTYITGLKLLRDVDLQKIKYTAEIAEFIGSQVYRVFSQTTGDDMARAQRPAIKEILGRFVYIDEGKNLLIGVTADNFEGHPELVSTKPDTLSKSIKLIPDLLKVTGLDIQTENDLPSNRFSFYSDWNLKDLVTLALALKQPSMTIEFKDRGNLLFSDISYDKRYMELRDRITHNLNVSIVIAGTENRILTELTGLNEGYEVRSGEFENLPEPSTTKLTVQGNKNMLSKVKRGIVVGNENHLAAQIILNAQGNGNHLSATMRIAVQGNSNRFLGPEKRFKRLYITGNRNHDNFTVPLSSELKFTRVLHEANLQIKGDSNELGHLVNPEGEVMDVAVAEGTVLGSRNAIFGSKFYEISGNDNRLLQSEVIAVRGNQNQISRSTFHGALHGSNNYFATVELVNFTGSKNILSNLNGNRVDLCANNRTQDGTLESSPAWKFWVKDPWSCW